MSTEAMDRIRAELIKKIRQTGVVPDDFVVPLVDGYETVIAQVSALTAENERLREQVRSERLRADINAQDWIERAKAAEAEEDPNG